jgi:Glycosyl transferase family 2/Glycosyl transferases group 1
MRIAFIDHSYHKQTLSTRFFLDLVSDLGDVKLFYDDSWRNGENEWRAEFVENDFDLIIIWQVTEAFEVLSGKHRNVVFVPMYDAMLVEGEFHWSDLFLQARCISFSRRLHRELQIRGAKSEYFKFFPDPSRFEIVSDFSELRPYFWYRSSRINLDKILSFCRENAVQQLTIHNVPDPEQEKLAIRNFDGPFPRFKISDWYNTQDEYRSELLQHNVYFAPRDVEGIGFSFLEAMASGMCVVAPDMPTMNEYISNGTNGLLYSLEKRFPVDLSKAKEIGARARETIERGFVGWQKQQKCLVDFLITPGEFLKPRQRPSKSTAASESRNLPKISIVTVCMNAEQVVQKTIESVLGQDYGNFEYIILDGASTDATAKVIQWYDPHLSYWHSEKDQGVYYAMNEAVTKCTGDFVLFMNAGDTFVDQTALTRMFSKAPSDADVVYGHHFYVPADGIPDYHPAADFETTWHRLTKGYVWYDWLAGMPGHQATAVRRTSLTEFRFDTKYRVAADHDVLFRAKLNGATFFNSDELISVYVGGGMSAQNFDLCKNEWRAIARTYGDAEAVEHFYAHMDNPSSTSDDKSEDIQSASPRGPDVFSTCFSLIGFDKLEGPYPALKIPRIRWAFGPTAQIEIVRGTFPKLARVRVATWLEHQVVTVVVAGEIISQHKIPVIARNNFAFNELVIDLSQCKGGDRITLEFSAWEKSAERPIAVMLGGLDSI